MGRKRRAADENKHQRESGNPTGHTALTEPGDSAVDTENGHEAGADPALSEELDRLTRERDDYRDRYLRAMAEMENVRRRARLDVEDARKFANERLLGDLLPVLDNFGRALDAAEQTPNFEALKSGVDLIYRQLGDVLGRAGLEEIEAVGKPFDPNLHEAILQVEPEEGQPPHQVVEELRPGYKLNERVLRPTLVKVTAG